MSVKFSRGLPTDGLVLYYDFGNPRCSGRFQTANSATGGNTIVERTFNNQVCVLHTFTSLGVSTFTPNQFFEIIGIVVAGGGGGGGIIGGGGGAGGVLYVNREVNASPVEIYVGRGGRGGAGWNSLNQAGERGENSRFGHLIAYGGGGGGAFGGNGVSNWFGQPINSPVNGGCGGGSTLSIAAGVAVVGQGTEGGTGGNNDRGGGGGGNGSSGGSPSGATAGAGGAGNDWSGYFGTSFGVSGRIGGGGGGGSRGGVAGITGGGTGGSGGGGNGTINTTRAQDGTANTGGGGGGAGYNGDSYVQVGGNGGSGLVLIQYPKYNSLHDLTGLFTDSTDYKEYLDADPHGVITYSSTGGGSLVFNGTNTRLEVPSNPNLILNAMTISLWVFSSNFDTNGYFIEKTAGGVKDTGYSLFIQNQSLYFRTINTSPADSWLSAINSLGLVNNAWNNIVVTFDGIYKRFYRNGVLNTVSAPVVGSVFQGTGPTYIGSSGTTFSSHFNGRISTLSVHNRALSDSEILTNFNLMKSRFGL